jgi:hypothetical protein
MGSSVSLKDEIFCACHHISTGLYPAQLLVKYGSTCRLNLAFTRTGLERRKLFTYWKYRRKFLNTRSEGGEMGGGGERRKSVIKLLMDSSHQWASFLLRMACCIKLYLHNFVNR